MGHFVTEADRKELHADWWDEGETVTIKRFTYLDEQFIAGHSAVGEPIVDDFGNLRVYIDRSLWAEARLMRGIVAWTLQDDEGQAVPCTDEAKTKLSDRDGAFIHNAISELNRERSAEEQESF